MSRPSEADPAPVYVNVVTYAGHAEAVAAYMAKGRRVSVTGRLDHRECTAEGVRHSIHEVVASQVEFLDALRKGSSGAQPGPDDEYGDEPF